MEMRSWRTGVSAYLARELNAPKTSGDIVYCMKRRFSLQTGHD